MRKIILAANWKMHMTVAETAAYLKTFLAESGDDTDLDVVIIPPFTALAKASELISETYSLKLGAQNMNAHKSGAFTGEVSASMLRELVRPLRGDRPQRAATAFRRVRTPSSTRRSTRRTKGP